MRILLLLSLLVYPIAGMQACDSREDTQNQDNLPQSLLEEAEQGDADAQSRLGRAYYLGEGVQQDYEKAAHWLTKAAEQGMAESQLMLGLSYWAGQGVPQDYEKAVHWFTKAAEQDNAEAQLLLGGMCYFGHGVKQNYEKAFYWNTKAAEQGEAGGQFGLGIMYHEGQGVEQDYEKAFYWYAKAAEQGEAGAQFALGQMYHEGQGVEQDYEKAFHWFTKAAEQGDAEAQSRLGLMYYIGQGMPQNYEKAAYWLTKAAEKGNAQAQSCLGVMCYKGEGVIEDYVEAYKWFLLAGKNGLDVFDLKDLLRKEMTPAQIAKAQSLAKQFVAKPTSGSASDEQAIVPGVKGYGTGFFVSSNGYVVTAAHVIKDAKQIRLLNRHTETSARIVYKDEALDVAVLKADKTDCPFLPIISSSKAETGERVFTLGFPQVTIQGREVKYTEGSINALSGIGGNQRFFQISIPVQPGNSGGPLLNSKGEVVGVIAARLDAIAMLIETGAIPQNVNYAVKSSFVLPFLDNLKGFASEKKPMPSEKIELIEEAKKAVVLVICY